MVFLNIIVPLLFIVIILKQLKYRRELIIPTKKGCVEIITVLFCVIILICIIYFYANTWIHYLTGALGILMFISIWIKQGITSKGFASMYKYKEIILWNEIEKAMVINSKDIKIKLLGNFMEQTFHFKKNDYDKVVGILKENLPKEEQLQIK